MSDYIKLENVSKKFKIGHSNGTLLFELLATVSRQRPREIFWALKNFSLSAYPGEAIGIIGLNGAGKTTLLKVIAGIYEIDGGSLLVSRSVMPLISLDIGLVERLTMRDNIYLAGSLLGLSRNQISQCFDQIVDLAELGGFIDCKLCQFSSGMRARLVFSIVINSVKISQPEILLIDEIFAVGDGIFKQKSISEMKKLKKNNVTILFVAHDLEFIKDHSDRVLWLDRGQVRELGEPSVVVTHYQKFLEDNINHGQRQ